VVWVVAAVVVVVMLMVENVDFEVGMVNGLGVDSFFGVEFIIID